jgi:nitrous oxide reductase
MESSDRATAQGNERIERKGNVVHVHAVVIRSHYKPDIIKVKQGDHVILDITNVESARDATHGFGLQPDHGPISGWPQRCAEWLDAKGLAAPGLL